MTPENRATLEANGISEQCYAIALPIVDSLMSAVRQEERDRMAGLVDSLEAAIQIARYYNLNAAQKRVINKSAKTLARSKTGGGG